MPALGTSYEGGHGRFVEAILPHVDFVEVTPDTIADYGEGRPKIPEPTLDQLAEIANEVPIVVHGVGLSIGSADGWNEHYIGLLDQIFSRVDVRWHSEHLAFTQVEGRAFGTMLAMPRCQQAVEIVSARVEKLRARYRREFLLEHVVSYLPDPLAEMDDATFLNRLIDASGCGLLLDVYNLQCDSANRALDIPIFLQRLDLSAVREIHVACGVEQGGFLMDIHSRRTMPSTRALLTSVLQRSPNVELVTFEILKEAVPVLGYDAWAAELSLLRAEVADRGSANVPKRDEQAAAWPRASAGRSRLASRGQSLPGSDASQGDCSLVA